MRRVLGSSRLRNREDIGGEQYRALGTAAVTNPQESSLERATHSVKTVFLIVMENHNWSQIAGNRSTPYINDTLLPMGAKAEHSVNGAVHPGEPNYVWLEAGDSLDAPHGAGDLQRAAVPPRGGERDEPFGPLRVVPLTSSA